MWQAASKFIRNEEGATAVEYALIAALVAVAIIASLGDLRKGLDDIFKSIGTKLTNSKAT